MSSNPFPFMLRYGTIYLMNIGSGEILEEALIGLRKKRKRVQIINGLLLFSLVAVITVGATSLFSFVHSGGIYFSFLKVITITGLCFGLGRYLLPALFKKEGPRELALELERISPGLGEEALNAILLKSDCKKSGNDLGISRFLIEAHVDVVDTKIRTLDLSPALPEERLKKHRKIILAAFSLSLIILMLSPKGFRSFLLSTQILPPSEPGLLGLADITLRYQYPDYTKIPALGAHAGTGDVRGIKGTRVTFEATPLKPVDKPNLVVEGGNTVPAGLEKGRIRAEFNIVSDGRFFIESKDRRSRSRAFKIIAEEDALPRVTIEASHGKSIEVDPRAKLDIMYQGQDDFGITKLSLSWQTRKGERSRLIKQEREEPEKVEGAFQWDLSMVDFEPDETIEARIKAYDNDTISGPKAALSNAIKIRLKNSRQKHQDMLSWTDRVLEDFLNILGDQIEHSRNEGRFPVSSAKTKVDEKAPGQVDHAGIRKAQEALTGKIETALGFLSQVLGKMEEDDFSDYTFFLALSNMRVRIEGFFQERRALISSSASISLDRLDSLIVREINEFEDDILFLDSMLKGERLKESLLHGKDTLRGYDELSQLLDKLRETGDESIKREIARKIEELRNLISQLTERISAINPDTYQGFLNPDAFDSFDLTGKLDEITSLIQQGKIEEALDLLASMKRGLESMIASLESGFQSFSADSLSAEITKLSELIARLEGVEKQETSLKQRTEALKESMLKSSSRTNSPLEFLERERKKLEELKEALAKARDKTPLDAPEKEPFPGSHPIDRVVRQSEELERWLQALEFEKALEQAKELESDTGALKNLNEAVWKRQDNEEEILKSEELSGAVLQDIEHFLKGGTEGVESHDIAQRQDRIEKETGDLGDAIGEYGDQFSLSPKIGENLAQSKAFMGGASRSLRAREISKAISNQEEAIKSLKKAREEVSQLLRRYQMSAKGQGPPVPLILGANRFREGARGIDTGYVEIPPPGESQSGKEFKENLLKALKERSPAGYSELNKRYYERIIK